jgi:preprotein translocase subunit YajC
VAGFSTLTALLTAALSLSTAVIHPLQDAAAAPKSEASAPSTAAAPASQAPAVETAPAAAAPAADPQKTSATKSSPATGAGRNQEPPPFWFQMLPFAFLAIIFWLVILRPQQREQRRRQELLNLIKKNDRVVTNGGLIGTIADLSSDGRFVTLKVDDSTRIRFLRSAIAGPLEEKAESAEKK